jgi:hypothetical protein
VIAKENRPAGTGRHPHTTGKVDSPQTSIQRQPPLTVPNIEPDADNLGAALKWAEAGWFVLPVKRGTKDPGSIVGKRWQDKSSREPKQIAAWFAGTDHDIAVHCGRSGAVVLDVDKPKLVPEHWRTHLDTAPYQSTRPGTPRRGHYIYAMPPDRSIGNPNFPGGEVRGLNGVIIVANSSHRDGGQYRVRRPGPVPLLPDAIANELHDSSPGEDAATDPQVAAFLVEHRQANHPDLLLAPVRKLETRIAEGGARHDATVSALTWAMEEAAAGCYAADDAQAAIKEVFLTAIAAQRKPDDRVVTGARAVSEYHGILAWAVGQARAKTFDELTDRRARAERNGIRDNRMTDNAQSAGGKGNSESSDQTSDLYVVTLIPASDIVSDIPDWVWERDDLGRIQLGVLTLFAGRPGAGKSTAARWFAAQFSKATLDGCWKNKPQKVAYIASEESLQQVVKPGLQLAGANMDNIVFPEVTFNGDVVALMSDRDEAELTKQLKAQNVRAIFVDPIMATIRSKTDIYRNNELRQALAPWVRIAKHINGIVVGVVHLVKGNSGDIVASVNGSSAFGEVARCVFGFAKDPQNDGERVMSQVKNACGVEDLSLSFELDVKLFTADSGREGLMALFSITGDSDTTVSEVLSTAGGKLRASTQQVLDYVNSRTETGAEVLVDAGLAKTQATANKMLNRLSRRGLIDNPTWGCYCPKTPKAPK